MGKCGNLIFKNSAKKAQTKNNNGKMSKNGE
jgi:hypothetical protein